MFLTFSWWMAHSGLYITSIRVWMYDVPGGKKLALRFPPSDRMSNMSRIMRICCAVERGFYFTSNSAG